MAPPARIWRRPAREREPKPRATPGGSRADEPSGQNLVRDSVFLKAGSGLVDGARVAGLGNKENEAIRTRTSMKSGADLQALESLYRNHYGDFVRTASAITNSRETGKDAVHDAFVAAVRKRRSYRADGTLEAWVWAIVVRAAMRRRRRAEEIQFATPVDDAVWNDSQGEDAYAGVRGAIAALPKRQRLVLFLRYYADLDYRTIANLAGIRIGTVGAELHAARAALRSYVEEVECRD